MTSILDEKDKDVNKHKSKALGKTQSTVNVNLSNKWRGFAKNKACQATLRGFPWKNHNMGKNKANKSLLWTTLTSGKNKGNSLEECHRYPPLFRSWLYERPTWGPVFVNWKKLKRSFAFAEKKRQTAKIASSVCCAACTPNSVSGHLCFLSIYFVSLLARCVLKWLLLCFVPFWHSVSSNDLLSESREILTQSLMEFVP